MDTSTNPGGVTQDPGGTEATTQATTEQKPNTVSHDTYKKAVDESKSLKARLAAFEAKERSELEKSGEFQKLYEAAKADKEKLAEEAKVERARFAYSSVSSQFQAEAAKLGCKKPEALEKLVDLKEISSKVGANYVVDKDALKAFVEKAQKENDFLFAKEAPGFRDSAPAGGKPAGEKTLAEELKGCKTQNELDAVLKKYGKN